MHCPDCGGKTRTVITRAWEGATWRSLRCTCCDRSLVSRETFQDQWPDNLWALESRRRRRAARPDAPPAPAPAPPPKRPDPNAGLALSGIWHSVVAPAQQLARN